MHHLIISHKYLLEITFTIPENEAINYQQIHLITLPEKFHEYQLKNVHLTMLCAETEEEIKIRIRDTKTVEIGKKKKFQRNL